MGIVLIPLERKAVEAINNSRRFRRLSQKFILGYPELFYRKTSKFTNTKILIDNAKFELKLSAEICGLRGRKNKLHAKKITPLGMLGDLVTKVKEKKVSACSTRNNFPHPPKK